MYMYFTILKHNYILFYYMTEKKYPTKFENICTILFFIFIICMLIYSGVAIFLS